MNLVRKIKISKLTEVEFSETELEIINFIKTNLVDLIPFTIDNYNQSIFYMNEKCDWIFDYDSKYKVIWIRHDSFINLLEHKYKIKTIDIKYLITDIFTNIFKMDVYNFISLQYYHYGEIESEFKMREKRKKLELNLLPSNITHYNLHLKFCDKSFINKLENTKNLLLNINQVGNNY